jgi:L-asparaginase II
MNSTDGHPLVEVLRGKIVESIHFGSLVAVDSSGCQLINFGNPETVTFLRSSAKPFQALPFVQSGGLEAFGLSERETAILCASHTGTDDHVQVVSCIQDKLNLGEEALLCGTHMPYDEATARQMIRSGAVPTPNRNNCSGKHTGMLAYCLLHHLPVEDYINPHHPLQEIILQTFAEMCEMKVQDVALGTDGCSAPNFAAPLRNAALGYARLADPSGLSDNRAAALRKIFHAMTSHPDMVSGPEHFDTVLMQVMDGQVACKAGAEGYQALGLLPGALGSNSRGVGITFKIADGDASGRARSIVTVAILRELGALGNSQAEALARYDQRPIHNLRKLEVGVIRTSFRN